jgi:hypothetical protein
LPPISTEYLVSTVRDALNTKPFCALPYAFSIGSFLFVQSLAFASVAKWPTPSLHAFPQEAFAALAAFDLMFIF